MSACVLDCSAVAGWCFEDEADSWADKMLDFVAEHGAIVPSHWHLEVGNMLLQAYKRKRISKAGISERLQLISKLPLSVDGATHNFAFNTIMLNAQREQLTSYDASYLELAMRHDLPLATKDHALKKACKRVGVLCI